ncbi:MAG: sugar ABC transporter substrate-binding protein [Endomicrobia bacterium]|nr:sugar ABC transporter substrate-binding protein [Endomicrobiia bacterium]
MKKFEKVIGVLGFCFLFLFFSCGKKQEVSKEGKVTINIWIMPNSPKPVIDLEDVLSDFKKDNPNIDIVITGIDWGAAWSKITVAATSGVAPDICQLGTTWVGTIASMDALLTLNDYVNEIGGQDAFLPASWNTSGIEGSGVVTSIPWFVDVRGIYYRTDIFNKLGLTKKDLDTWESFEATLQKIKKAKVVMDKSNNIYVGKEAEEMLKKDPTCIVVEPIGIPGKNDWNVIHNFVPWIWASGGDLLTRDRKEAIFNSKEAMQGILFYTNLVRKGLVSTKTLELNTAQVSTNFVNGAYAMYFDTSHMVKYMSLPQSEGGFSDGIASKNYDVALFPKGPKGRYHFFGGSNLAIFKYTKNPKEAWKVLAYLCSKEAQIKYAQKTGFMPTRKDAFVDPYFEKDPKRSVFKEATKYGKSYPCIPAWGPIEPILTRRLGILWDYVAGVYGNCTDEIIKQQIDMAVQEVNSVLKTSGNNNNKK